MKKAASSARLCAAARTASCLFDEVEKAHPDVFNVLLQVLDDGRITDGQGRTVDFKNTVLIMTSNIGSSAIQDVSNPEQRDALVRDSLKQFFRPEFLNRIDEIVIFDRLDAAQLDQIVKIQLQRVIDRLAKQFCGGSECSLVFSAILSNFCFPRISESPIIYVRQSQAARSIWTANQRRPDRPGGDGVGNCLSDWSYSRDATVFCGGYQ
jgi:hypothetical protein